MKKKKKNNKWKLIRFLSLLLFVASLTFLLYYIVLQPMYSRHINDKYRKIYYSSGTVTTTPAKEETTTNNEESSNDNFIIQLADTPDGAKNTEGILLKFEKLLKYNSDVKGWLHIDGTQIDYPVLQNLEKTDYYLNHDFEGTLDKNGCLYIDGHCSIDTPTKNIVIHGHNMESTNMMFYELPNYGKLEYYRQHPVITFDSIYDESQWLVFALIRVSGLVSRNYDYNFMTGNFETDEDFLNFIYETQIRSLYHTPVPINENDTLLMLSTCSYEINDARTIVVARKLRENENVNIDTSKIYIKDSVLYPEAWYKIYDGEKPSYTNFMDALAFDEINWYDGEIECENQIGTEITIDGLIYQITSSDTAKFVGSKKKKITNVEIPDKLDLESGRILQVTEVVDNSFSELTKLESVKIGNNVSSIPDKCFKDCNKLTSVILGKSITTIGKKSFEGLVNLKKITLNSTNLQEIGNNAFKNINSDAKIKIKNNYKTYKKLVTESGIDDTVEITK